MFSIRITIRNISEWISFLQSIPNGVKGIAMRAFAEYIIGNEQHGLRHYPGYKYVSRKKAYGRTFSSNAQQRWFFANGAKVGNYRTMRLQRGWKIGGSAQTRLYIINPVPYASYVMGNAQANQPRLAGWKHFMEIVNNNFKGGIRAAQAAVNAWLGSK